MSKDLQIAIVLFLMALFLSGEPVKASGGEEVFTCPVVAVFESIKIGRCEDGNTIFYVNQFGFMMPEPY